jgi:hypothetical protein
VGMEDLVLLGQRELLLSLMVAELILVVAWWELLVAMLFWYLLILHDATFGIRDDRLLRGDVYGSNLIGLEVVYFRGNVELRWTRIGRDTLSEE